MKTTGPELRKPSGPTDTMLDRDDIYTLIAADKTLQEILDRYEHLAERNAHKLAYIAHAALRHHARGEDSGETPDTVMTVDDAKLLTNILVVLDGINKDYGYPGGTIFDLIEVAYAEGREIREDDPKLKQELKALRDIPDDMSP